jgi:hypothetical protein
VTAFATWGMVTDAQGRVGTALHLVNAASKGEEGGRTIPLNKALRQALIELKATRNAPEPREHLIHSERDIGMSSDREGVAVIPARSDCVSRAGDSDSLSLDIVQMIGAITHAEESGAAPSRAGDGARDGGKARVGLPAPSIAPRNNRDGVPLAPIFAHEHGADLEAPWAVRFRIASCDVAQKLRGLRIKPAEGLFLDVPAEKPRHEILAERWRRPAKRFPAGWPIPTKGIRGGNSGGRANA